MALTKVQICNMALSEIGNERVQLTNSVFASNTGKAYEQCDLHYEQTLRELVRMHSWNCTKERATLVETVPLITDSDDVEFTYFATTNGKAEFQNSTNDMSIRWNSTLERWEYDEAYAAPFVALYYNEGTGNVPPEDTWLKVSDDSDSGWTLDLTYDFGWEHAFVIPTDCIRALYLTNTDESMTPLQPRIEWSMEQGIIMTNHSEVYLLYIKEPDPGTMDSLFAQAFYTLLASKLAKPIAGDEQLGVSILKKFHELILPEARRVNAFEGKDSPVVDSDWLEATFTSPSSLGSSWPPFGTATWTTAFPWS